MFDRQETCASYEQMPNAGSNTATSSLRQTLINNSGICVIPSSILLEFPEVKKYVGFLKQKFTDSASDYDTYLRPVIENVAEYMQLLPAAESRPDGEPVSPLGHHVEKMGLLIHSLQTAILAVKLTVERNTVIKYQCQDRVLLQRALRIAAAIGGLVHDIGKINDWSIYTVLETAFGSEQRFYSFYESLPGFLARESSKSQDEIYYDFRHPELVKPRYIVTSAKEGRINLHEPLGTALLLKLVPERTLHLVGQASLDLLEQLVLCGINGALIHKYRRPNHLTELIKLADKLSCSVWRNEKRRKTEGEHTKKAESVRESAYPEGPAINDSISREDTAVKTAPASGISRVNLLKLIKEEITKLQEPYCVGSADIRSIAELSNEQKTSYLQALSLKISTALADDNALSRLFSEIDKDLAGKDSCIICATTDGINCFAAFKVRSKFARERTYEKQVRESLIYHSLAPFCSDSDSYRQAVDVVHYQALTLSRLIAVYMLLKGASLKRLEFRDCDESQADPVNSHELIEYLKWQLIELPKGKLLFDRFEVQGSLSAHTDSRVTLEALWYAVDLFHLPVSMQYQQGLNPKNQKPPYIFTAQSEDEYSSTPDLVVSFRKEALSGYTPLKSVLIELRKESARLKKEGGQYFEK